MKMSRSDKNRLLVAFFFVCSASVALFAITSAKLLAIPLASQNLAAATKPMNPNSQPQPQKEDKVGDCEQKYRACVKTAKSDILREKCESDWKKCVSGQCKTREVKTSSGLHEWCPRDADCQTSCTESATGKGDLISCCKGGPTHANKCRTDIGGKCYDNISAKEFADLTKKNILNDPKTTPTEKAIELDQRIDSIGNITRYENEDAKKKYDAEWLRAEDLKDASLKDYLNAPPGTPQKIEASQKIAEMAKQADEIKNNAWKEYQATEQAGKVLIGDAIDDKIRLADKVRESTWQTFIQQTAPMPISPPGGNTFGDQINMRQYPGSERPTPPKKPWYKFW